MALRGMRHHYYTIKVEPEDNMPQPAAIAGTDEPSRKADSAGPGEAAATSLHAVTMLRLVCHGPHPLTRPHSCICPA